MPHLQGRAAWRRRLSQSSKLLACALAAASACLAVPGTSWADSSSLTTDAGGLPLVSAAQLSPGHVLERCIVLTTPTVYTSADLAMYVTVDGDLANHLNVTVESGQGGGFSDCTGFAGRLVYVGTLGGLASTYSLQQPERVGRYSATVSSVTLRLRFSVQDDNAAQGQTTTAAFWWLPISPETTPAPPTTPPAPSVAPTTTTPAAGTPTTPPPPVPTVTHPSRPTATAAPAPSATSRPTLAPHPIRTVSDPPAATLAPPVGVPFSTGDGKKPTVALPPAVGGDGGDDNTPAGILGQLATGLGTGVANVAHTVSVAAAPALRGAAYTSLLIVPLVLLFLLVQRVIDRRDPKLALAPSYGDPFLGFADRHHPTHRQGDPP
ncbi:hypothetical protein acdb102_46000 [Acidothermaceae bacterium B102]|nr:hypothetical protein acdb102_46000 [Acidothermaceae bacterium B102]